MCHSQLWSLLRKQDPLRLLTFFAGCLILLLLGGILSEIAVGAWPAIQKTGWRFLCDSCWQPNNNTYGILPMILGTLESSLIALLLAFPLGLAMALFLTENFLPPSLKESLGFLVEMLAATPSVVYGLWGLFVVVPLVQKYGIVISRHLSVIPLFKGPVYGNSLLAASLVLALMILPTITALVRQTLRAIPGNLREGAYALGATRWETIFRVLIPYSAPGITAATALALGRAMGETIAVAMLIGNSQRWSISLFSSSNTLSALLANQFSEAEGLQVHALMYAALVLVLMTLATNLIGELILRRYQKRSFAT